MHHGELAKLFARQLAQQQTNLVLVARSQDKLEALATELSSKYEIDTEVIVKDLTEPAIGKFLFDTLVDKGI